MCVCPSLPYPLPPLPYPLPSSPSLPPLSSPSLHLPLSSPQMLRLKGKNRLHPSAIYHMVDFLDTFVLRVGILEAKEAPHQTMFSDIRGLFFKWVTDTHMHTCTHTHARMRAHTHIQSLGWVFNQISSAYLNSSPIPIRL